MDEQGSSAQDPEPGDTITLEALSEEDLSHIVNNPHYRSMLQDLLAPYIAGTSADSDPVGQQDRGRGTDPATRELEAAEMAPDTRLSDLQRRVNTTALSKEERTAMLRRHPKPDRAMMAPPKLDPFILDFAHKKIDRVWDAALARIQGSLLYAANPLTNPWANLG